MRLHITPSTRAYTFFSNGMVLKGARLKLMREGYRDLQYDVRKYPHRNQWGEQVVSFSYYIIFPHDEDAIQFKLAYM